jgi:hypothetical protein
MSMIMGIIFAPYATRMPSCEALMRVSSVLLVHPPRRRPDAGGGAAHVFLWPRFVRRVRLSLRTVPSRKDNGPISRIAA